MNKLLIVLLAVCLVSVHAFVKRDAPAASAPANNENLLENLQKQASDLLADASGKLKELFNPDEIKKNFDSAVDKATELLNQSKKKE